MKRNYPLIIIISILFFKTSYSQKLNYSSLLIPDSLKVNATTVIRENLLEILIKTVDKQIIKRRYVVTVLNKNGNNNVKLYEYYNNDATIRKLSVKVYNALGAEIKKYSKSKFTDVSAVDGGTLYSDAKVKYINYTPTSYPYTIIFESEVENSSTGFIPKWYPINSYKTSVEKSIYKIINPLNLTIRKKENNLKGYKINNLSKNNSIHYELVNAPAKKRELNSPYFNEITPFVSVALNNFSLKGVRGVATNWKEFGKWINNKLLKDKTKLNENTVNTIKDLVKNAKNDIEKARIVYNYVQNRTRYISVQVGIGGWEPISADEVDKVGYGDCKGLTNYTKALLDAVDVESYYTIVYAKKRRDIDKEFVSIQGNHVILNIPNNGNDIWLECTSQIMPFGFLGDFTDDRNVLVITPEGGIIKRTPAYKNELNTQTTKATVTLYNNGDITSSINRTSKGIQYDDKFFIEQKSNEDLKKHYISNVWNYNNNLEIKSINLENNKDSVSFSEKIKLNINKYATISGNDYFFRLNFFNKFSYIPKRYKNRTLPLKINRGFLDKDEFTITIPKGYKIPEKLIFKEVKTKFGTYKISLTKVNEKTLLYKKLFLLKEGTYPKEDYKKYRRFLKNIVKLENSRIAISKL